MALRTVKPLSKEQWRVLIDAVKAGPTPAQKKTLQKAREFYKAHKND